MPSLLSKKPTWDGYVGDATKYMITKEEALRRQKERVSKHNVLLSNVTPTKSRANIKRNIKQKKPVSSSSSSSSSLTYKHKEMNSLDLVDREVEATNIFITQSKINDDDDGDDDDYNNTNPSTFITNKKHNNHVSFSNNDDDAKNMTIDVKLNMTSDTFNNTNDNTIAYNNTGDVKVQKVKKSNNSKRAEQIKLRNRNMNISNSFRSSARSNNNYQNANISSNSSTISNNDLEDIVQQIRSLNGELRYYEQLSGRRSVFDAEELDLAMEAMVDDSDSSKKFNQASVMRYLVQLVCQSMSYLLQSQIDIVERDAKFEALAEKVNLLNKIVLPSDDNKPMITKIKADPMTPSKNNLDTVNGISPVNASLTSPDVGFNISIAATPLTTKSGADIIERSKMTGSSPTDWLFASSQLSRNNDKGTTPIRLFAKPTHFVPPATNNLTVHASSLAESIIGTEENDIGKFDEVSTNLLSKFMMTSPSKNDSNMFSQITDTMNEKSIEESRMRELYQYLSERGILSSTSITSRSTELPSPPTEAPIVIMPPVPETAPLHPYKKVYDARTGHYDAI